MSESNDNSIRFDIQDKIEQIKKKAEKKHSHFDKTVQLKFWPEELRAAPSCLLRSALFMMVKKGRRKVFFDGLLASWSGVKISYTGYQLDQCDLDVWMQALQEAEGRLGYRVVLNESLFLEKIGRTKTGPNINWLRKSLGRMQACGVCLSMENLEYQGSLIQEFGRDKNNGKYYVALNPYFADIFEKGKTYIDLDKRLLIKGDLSKWLQGYVCSHKATKRKPHLIGLEKLVHLCGSSHSNIRFFRRDLILAMKQLQDKQIVESWVITSNGSVLQFVRPKRIKKSE